jgi:predicted  nucleic acid-binding Zn-ribbon protein
MEIKLHPAVAEAQERIATLKAEMVSLYTELTDLRDTEAPVMEAIYMERIGRFEVIAYELYMQVQFLKKRRQLMLKYLNRGQHPDEAEIEVEIKRLNRVLSKKQKELHDQLYRAKATFEAGFLSEEDTIALKSLYKELVRKLHPDLHPDQTPVEAAWFKDAVAAYKKNDIEALQRVAELAELGATQDVINPLTPIEDLANRVLELQRKVDSLQEEIENELNTYPLNLRDMMADEEAVKAQILAIQRQTKQLTDKRDELLDQLAEMGWTPYEE